MVYRETVRRLKKGDKNRKRHNCIALSRTLSMVAAWCAVGMVQTSAE